jgi:LPXTG-site transpeptidase (sortase) family protein
MHIIKEIFGFLLTFGIIFSISFAALNFTAVKSMFNYHFSKNNNEEIIKESIGEKKLAEIPLPPKGAKKLIKKEFPPLHLSVAPLDYRIIIPKIAKNVPLVEMSDKYISDDLWGKFEKEVQNALRNGVVHYPGTARPGQFGNVFFTGHSSYYPWDEGNYKDVFVNLKQLDVGDEYYVYYQQKKHAYKITEKKEVRPTEVGVLEQPRNKKLSSIMTCWPLGTTLRRLIVVAEEV